MNNNNSNMKKRDNTSILKDSGDDNGIRNKKFKPKIWNSKLDETLWKLYNSYKSSGSYTTESAIYKRIFEDNVFVGINQSQISNRLSKLKSKKNKEINLGIASSFKTTVISTNTQNTSNLTTATFNLSSSAPSTPDFQLTSINGFDKQISPSPLPLPSPSQLQFQQQQQQQVIDYSRYKELEDTLKKYKKQNEMLFQNNDNLKDEIDTLNEIIYNLSPSTSVSATSPSLSASFESNHFNSDTAVLSRSSSTFNQDKYHNEDDIFIVFPNYYQGFQLIIKVVGIVDNRYHIEIDYINLNNFVSKSHHFIKCVDGFDAYTCTIKQNNQNVNALVLKKRLPTVSTITNCVFQK